MATQEKTHQELTLDESDTDLIEQALRWYAKRPHLPIVQNRIIKLLRRIDRARLGLEE